MGFGRPLWRLLLGLLLCASGAQAQTLVVRDVALVDPDSQAPARATLVLRDGVIASIEASDAAVLVEGAQVIDGRALFAMPGLMDAHVHAHRDGREAWHYPLYLAHGVTRVRDAGTHLGSVLAVRDPVEVARVARVPLPELLDPANRFSTELRGFRGPGFTAGGLFVWGFTAGLLSRLLDVAGIGEPWDQDRVLPVPAAQLREVEHQVEP